MGTITSANDGRRLVRVNVAMTQPNADSTLVSLR